MMLLQQFLSPYGRAPASSFLNMTVAQKAVEQISVLARNFVS